MCQFNTSDAIYFNYNDIEGTFEIQKFNIKCKIIKTFTLVTKIASGIYKYITYILTTNRTLLIYFNKNFMSDPVVINNVDDMTICYLLIDNKYYYVVGKGDFSIDNLIRIKNTTLVTKNKILWFDYYGKIPHVQNFEIDTNKLFYTYHATYLIEY